MFPNRKYISTLSLAALRIWREQNSARKRLDPGPARLTLNRLHVHFVHFGQFAFGLSHCLPCDAPINLLLRRWIRSRAKTHLNCILIDLFIFSLSISCSLALGVTAVGVMIDDLTGDTAIWTRKVYKMRVQRRMSFCMASRRWRRRTCFLFPMHLISFQGFSEDSHLEVQVYREMYIGHFFNPGKVARVTWRGSLPCPEQIRGGPARSYVMSCNSIDLGDTNLNVVVDHLSKYWILDAHV